MRVRPATVTDVHDLAVLLGQLGYPIAADVLARRVDRLAADPTTSLFVASGPLLDIRPARAVDVGCLGSHGRPGGIAKRERRRAVGRHCVALSPSDGEGFVAELVVELADDLRVAVRLEALQMQS